MKKILILIIILSVLLASCCYSVVVDEDRAKAVCIPYCLKMNLSYDDDSTTICSDTIHCACEGAPVRG